MYATMEWDEFDYKIFYDPGQIEGVKKLGFHIDEYRALPINSTYFQNTLDFRQAREIDFFFVGKPTNYRNSVLKPLQYSNLNFVWIAHGISGPDLGRYMRNSKFVLNVHADGLEAFEPRVYLGAASGAYVLSEKLSSPLQGFHQSILEIDDWSEEAMRYHLQRLKEINISYDMDSWVRMSGKTFVDGLIKRFGIA
jgi:hypothetical protein